MATLLKIANGRPAALGADDDFSTTGAVGVGTLAIGGGTALTTVDTDLSAVSTSDDSLASAKAIKAYVDSVATSSDLDFQGDSGGALSIDLDSETLTISGGVGLSSEGSGNTVTVNLDDTAVTAGDYGGSLKRLIATVDDQGRLTALAEATIANADADGSTKGVATFDADDFDASSGVISLGNSADGAVLAISGTANEVNVSRDNGTVTVGLPDDVTITGNLTVSGTTTTIDSTTVSVADPIFELGQNASDDNLDRGLKLLYNNGGAKIAFMGFDESENKFTMITDATDTSNVMSGDVGTLVADLEGDVTGALSGNASTATALATAGTITFTGDVVGGSTPTYTSGGDISIAMTIQSNSVALGDDTTGDFVGTIIAGAGLTSTGATSGEDTNHSLSVDANQDGNITSAANLVTVGALDSGSITSNFGNINIGSSSFQTSGTLGDGSGVIAMPTLVAMNGGHQVEAGEDLLGGEFVALASDGKLYAADHATTAAADGPFDCIVGVCQVNTSAGSDANILCTVGAKLTRPGSTTLTVGAPVFIGADGALAVTAPTTAGQAVIQVGVATSASEYIFTGIDLQLVN
ncbi:MAG: hypothetical protein VXZ72_00780 [Chlamydiota bacterium]|nr:hypothetical protein [Chlamydiota bacterium]